MKVKDIHRGGLFRYGGKIYIKFSHDGTKFVSGFEVRAGMGSSVNHFDPNTLIDPVDADFFVGELCVARTWHDPDIGQNEEKITLDPLDDQTPSKQELLDALNEIASSITPYD